jgi:signal transduction histidine kinase
MFCFRKRNSIKTKLLQGFLAVIIFASVVMSIAFIYIIHEIQMDHSYYLLDAASKVAWDIFNDRPLKLQIALEEICKFPEYQKGFEEQNEKTLYNFVDKLEKKYTYINAWVVTDAKGIVLSKSSTVNIKNGDRFLSELMNDSILQQKTIISTEKISNETIMAEDEKSFGYDLVTVIICPVIRSDGKVIGTVTGCYLLNGNFWIPNEYTKRIPNTYLSIGLKDGERIISNIKTKNLSLPVGSYQEDQLVKSISEDKQFFGKVINVAGESSIIKADPIVNYKGEIVGNIGVGTPVKNFNFFIKPNFFTILMVIITVVVFAVLLASAISNIIIKPIFKLENLALMIDDDMVKIENIKWSSDGEPEEVYSLANTMIKMAQTLNMKENETQSYVIELAEERSKLEEKIKLRTSELVDTVERLQLTNQYKSQFLANMSHELRTPLNSIIGFSGLLKDQVVGEMNPKQIFYTETIIYSAEELLQLINDILDLEKIEQGKVKFNPEKINVKKLVDSALFILSDSINKKGLTVNVSVDEDLPTPHWDYSKVKQIMTNLISNAVKFTPSEGLIEIFVKQQDDNIFLVVKDTGIGIKEEDMERVFLAFEQADFSYSRNFKGTGLGLAICKKNVELHNGRIWIEGNEPNGTILYVLLPISPRIPGKQGEYYHES